MEETAGIRMDDSPSPCAQCDSELMKIQKWGLGSWRERAEAGRMEWVWGKVVRFHCVVRKAYLRTCPLNTELQEVREKPQAHVGEERS